MIGPHRVGSHSVDNFAYSTCLSSIFVDHQIWTKYGANFAKFPTLFDVS